MQCLPSTVVRVRPPAEARFALVASRLTAPERGGRGTFAGALELVLEDRPTRPPKPPPWLPEEARSAFRALFRAPVAQTWRLEDRHALARLAVLRTAVEAGDLRGTTLSALARLEAELLLSPKAQPAGTRPNHERRRAGEIAPNVAAERSVSRP